MKNLLFRCFKNYSTKQKLTTLFTYFVYVFFAGYVVYYFATHEITFWSVVILIFCFVALVIAILQEYLKLLNNDALFSLNFKLDPKEAKQKYELVCKYDIFNIYKRDRGLFDVMIAIQEGKGQEALDIIAANDKKFRATVDLLLIMYYYQMRAYLLLGNYKRINEIWHYVDGIEHLKNKQKPKIFQWDELHGIHEIACGNRGMALDRFKNVNMVFMNPKEREFIIREKIELARNEADKKEFEEQYSTLMEVVKAYSA